MSDVQLGNHTAVFAPRSAQQRIRAFYCEVLGCKVNVHSDAVDRLQLGDIHF
jgi:catechol 2,3-dioxygenase-like lactoylglutathione lyase family enzyme